MLKRSVAVCYEPPAIDSAADLQDIEEQAAFLKKHLPHTVTLMPYTGDISAFLNTLTAVDIVWNLFETFNGREEQQYLGAALLELAGIPYTGTKTESLVLCADKRMIKPILSHEGITVPVMYTEGRFKPGQWILKPAKLHGSVGIGEHSVLDADSEQTLIHALHQQPELGLFAEQYICGDEYSATLLDCGDGLRTVAVAQMQFIDYPSDKPRILGFDAKWAEESADYRQTVRTFDIDDIVKTRIAEIADRAAQALHLEGFARIDFRTSPEATDIYIIDVNPNPGLGEDSGFIAACVHAGISIDRCLNFIIQTAR